MYPRVPSELDSKHTPSEEPSSDQDFGKSNLQALVHHTYTTSIDA